MTNTQRTALLATIIGTILILLVMGVVYFVTEMSDHTASGVCVTVE